MHTHLCHSWSAVVCLTFVLGLMWCKISNLYPGTDGGVPDVLPVSRDSWGCHRSFTFTPVLMGSQMSYLYTGGCPIYLTFPAGLLGCVVDEHVSIRQGCGVIVVAVVLEDVLGPVLRVLGGVCELEQVLAQVEAEGELLQHGTGGDEQTQGVGGRAGGLDELETHRQRDGR